MLIRCRNRQGVRMFQQLMARLRVRSPGIDQAAAQRARVDSITGLDTRIVFAERMHEARDAGVSGVLALCDLDRFKCLNDRIGNESGNDVLAVQAGRLREALPSEATLARYGGDVFIAFL